jgi:short-subunit dehydrogenase
LPRLIGDLLYARSGSIIVMMAIIGNKGGRLWWGLLLSAATMSGLAAALRRRRRRLDGQVAIVTGGSRGLGLLIAEELGRVGCRLVICARDADELARAQSHLEKRTETLAVVCDVTEPADVERVVAQALARFGRVDVLVNDAGTIQVGPLASLTLADFKRTFLVNFWGTVHATLAVLPLMRAQRAGRIVNIASICGKVAVPHLLPYSCSKFAVVGFSEGLREEVARDGVSVTTVVPGLMRTGSESFAEHKTPGDARWFTVAARMPLLAMSPQRAARRIVAAAARREAEIVVGVPAKLLRIMHDLFPAAVLGSLGLAERFLPTGGQPPADARRQ